MPHMSSYIMLDHVRLFEGNSLKVPKQNQHQNCWVYPDIFDYLLYDLRPVHVSLVA